MGRKQKQNKAPKPPPLDPLPQLRHRLEAQQRRIVASFVGYSVLVESAADADELYRCGFFGKGSLSRSKPAFRLQTCLPLAASTSMALPDHEPYIPQPIETDRSQSHPDHEPYIPQLIESDRSQSPASTQLVSRSHHTAFVAHYHPYQDTRSSVSSPSLDSSLATRDKRKRKRIFHAKSVDRSQNEDWLQHHQLEFDASVPLERMQLLLEEAFYLAHVGQLLTIRDSSTGDAMALEQCWRTFCAAKSSFPASYAVYHSFRVKCVASTRSARCFVWWQLAHATRPLA